MAMLCALLEVAILVGLGAGCGGGWRRPLTRVTLQLYHFCVFEMHLNLRMHLVLFLLVWLVLFCFDNMTFRF